MKCKPKMLELSDLPDGRYAMKMKGANIIPDNDGATIMFYQWEVCGGIVRLADTVSERDYPHISRSGLVGEIVNVYVPIATIEDLEAQAALMAIFGAPSTKVWAFKDYLALAKAWLPNIMGSHFIADIKAGEFKIVSVLGTQ